MSVRFRIRQFAALWAIAASAAVASPGSSTGGKLLPEVTVTARRMTEDARYIPVAVDVVDASRLSPGAVGNLQSLALAVPGLSYESFWGGMSGGSPILRGQAPPAAGGDHVGVFVDDIYQAGLALIDVMPLDLERIEVVRGPQNTLFGRGSFAGAIQYVPRAPTSMPGGSWHGAIGTRGLAALDGAWSQALGPGSWRIRLAAGHREARGSQDSLSGESLGDSRQDGVTMTIASNPERAPDWPLRLTARYQQGRFSHPAVSTIAAPDYNCGARNSASGLWSYYCGDAPIERRYDLSAGIPLSRQQSGQAALHMDHAFGNTRMRAVFGYYGAFGSFFRDFDASSQGFPLGVCTVGFNCPPIGPITTISRIASPNVVSRIDQHSRQWSAELRFTSDAAAGRKRPRWMAGASIWSTHQVDTGAFGVDREGLEPTERLTALDADNPLRAGPVSTLNAAVVDDSRTAQAIQNRTVMRRRGAALFGMLEQALGTASNLRLELRGEIERQQIDSRIAAFRFDTAIDPPPIEFGVWTPRLSFDRRFGNSWYAYASLARGARSGGINTAPGLEPRERHYAPETNWTRELGLRYAGRGPLASWNAVLYVIDWQDTQIAGVASTPGVTSLVMHNTAGIRTRGLEIDASFRLGPRLIGRIAYDFTAPRFVAGSDDAGSRAFCGLTQRPPASNLCNYGPPRTPGNGTIALVPYLDGRYAARTPRQSGTAALSVLPLPVSATWSLGGSVGLAFKQSMYERPIDGVRYGERALLDAEVSLMRGDWRISLWGSNLTDRRYIQAIAGRGGNFYPLMSRPLDALYGEGRRIGLSIGYSREGP